MVCVCVYMSMSAHTCIIFECSSVHVCVCLYVRERERESNVGYDEYKSIFRRNAAKDYSLCQSVIYINVGGGEGKQNENNTKQEKKKMSPPPPSLPEVKAR